MRLIDADELKEDLRQYFTDGVLDGISARLVFNQILHDIDNAPTVDTYTEDDVQYAIKEGHQVGYEMAKAKFERPQGEWIRHIRSIECSVCKNKFFADDENENCQDYEPCIDFNFNYCPNCGANMLFMRGNKND